MTFDYVSISAQDFFFSYQKYPWKCSESPDVESGAHAFCYELTTVACFLSSKPQRHAIFFFFVSFSKDVFLVLVKSETNRVTGKPNTGGTRVETERKGSLGEQTEGNSFGSWWRFLEHSQISAAQTPIVGFCSRSELAMARPPQRSRFEVARVWSCSAFLLVQRWQVHIAFHSDREHPQFL